MPELDRISDFSRDIVENILLRLPVKEAVRTCCLSSNWRLAWSSISDLVYDKNSISISDTCSDDEKLVETTMKMVEFVNKFLSIHDGSIHKFVIADVKPCPEALDGWMEVLSRKEIKKFLVTSQPFYPNNWEVPSTFWNLHCLREVELSNCIIELPEAFKGFKVLKSLKLERFDISESDLANLISGCPLLENLVLLSGNMDGMNIRIDAPKLKHLRLIFWQFRHVCLRTPSVVKATVCLNTKIFPPCKTNLIDLLDCLPNIEALELGLRSTRYLKYGYHPELSINFYHLTRLHIIMNFACQRETAVARQLFRHAPNLQELTAIEPYYAYCHKPDKWDQYTVFEHLKFVKIADYFKNHQSVLLFVAFLLASTPILEELCFECEVEDPEFLEKLVELKRASKNAKIYNSKIIL